MVVGIRIVIGTGTGEVVLNALHDAVEQPAAAAAAHDGVGDGDAEGLQLRGELRDDGAGARPDVRVVEGWHVHAVGIVREEFRAQVCVGEGPVGADLVDFCAEDCVGVGISMDISYLGT